MDINNRLSSLAQDELNQAPPYASPSSPPPHSPLRRFSSQASVGASASKVSKRKSRAVSKPPVKVLSADKENFRDMVQNLTGIPTSPRTVQAGQQWSQMGASSSTVCRPMVEWPVMVGSEFWVASRSEANMPTLDTSCMCITSRDLVGRKVSDGRLVQNQAMEGVPATAAACAPCTVHGSNPAIDGTPDFESFL